ncbi:hypothetical protein BJ165DRAFT_1141130 [Panaeolus papilionaceus]|nr:hypothetical protein BJ165DRAFT_1141130 [Panaeolus papilionaceus]
MVVRFECSACISDEDSSGAGTVETTDVLTRNVPAIEMKGPLRVMRGGKISQEATIEITTRSVANLARNGFNWREAYPQLFLSQTKHHYLAIHSRGHFMRLERRTLESDEFRRVEEEVQDDLKMLHAVLLTIQEAIRERGNVTSLSLVFRDDGCGGKKLVIYTREPSLSYPLEFISNF